MEARLGLTDFIRYEKTGEWDEDGYGDIYRVLFLGVEVDKVVEPFETCRNQQIEEKAEKVISALWNMAE